MEADQHQSGWPDLPLDLLGLVLRRLPSLADRIRLGAVCHGINSTIKLLPSSPQLPCIVLQDGTLFDLSSDVPVRQLHLPGDAVCYSAGGNMLFVLHRDGRCSLMNAFSGDMTPLPEVAAVLDKFHYLHDDVSKVVMSKSSPDHGPVIALQVGLQVILSTCRPAGETNSCINALVLASVDDIAFFQGKLYAVCARRLIAFDLNNGRFDDKPTLPGITVISELYDKPNHEYRYRKERYLVESNGKLLVAMLWIEHTYSGPRGMDRTNKSRCEVWEADMIASRWKKVDGGLDGRALFVSSPCSMSVLAAADGHHGAREDCIYFLHQLKNQWELGSGVYNMRTMTFTPLPKELTPLLHRLTPPLDVEPERFILGPKNNGRFPTWFSPDSATPGIVRHIGQGSRLVQNQGGRAPHFPLFLQRILLACHDWIRKWDFVD